MKRFILFLSGILFFTSFSLEAQISNERKTMSEGVYEALVIEIPDLNKKTTAGVWTDFTKDFYSSRSKYNRKTKEYFTDDASIAGIGKGNTIDIYTTIEEKGQGCVLNMWVDLGGAYLSNGEHPERYVEAEKMLIRFGLEAAKEKVRIDIKTQEKDLAGFNRDLTKLGSEKERLEKEIERAKQTIAEAEQGLEENAGKQEAKVEEISKQEELIQDTKKKLNDL